VISRDRRSRSLRLDRGRTRFRHRDRAGLPSIFRPAVHDAGHGHESRPAFGMRVGCRRANTSVSRIRRSAAGVQRATVLGLRVVDDREQIAAIPVIEVRRRRAPQPRSPAASIALPRLEHLQSGSDASGWLVANYPGCVRTTATASSGVRRGRFARPAGGSRSCADALLAGSQRDNGDAARVSMDPP